MRYKKLKVYQFCSRLLFTFFIPISFIYASCSGLQVVDDWAWLNEPRFACAKKAVFEHYHQMTGQYLEWRKSTDFSQPSTFNTVAAKARILLFNEESGGVDVIEAAHGREILHATDLVSSLPNAHHKTMFLAGEEEKYIEVLKEEEKALKLFGSFRSWHIAAHFINRHDIIKDAVETYNIIMGEISFYSEANKQRREAAVTALREIPFELRGDIYKKEDEEGGIRTVELKGKQIEEKSIFKYRDMHLYDSEAFACDNLLKQLRCYQAKSQYDKQRTKAFLLFLTERDPCLCCSVTIKDYLSRKIFEQGLCSEVIPIVVSLMDYKERSSDGKVGDIIIRNKIISYPQKEDEDVNDIEYEEGQETISNPPPYVLRLYRDERLTETPPIEVASTIYSMFDQLYKQAS